MFYIQKMQQNSYWNALVVEVCMLRINFGIISIIRLPALIGIAPSHLFCLSWGTLKTRDFHLTVQFQTIKIQTWL